MRKLVIALTMGAAMGVGMLAVAADPADHTPELNAYVSLKFDGPRAQSRNFFYGLRLDHDRRLLSEPLAPYAQLEFKGSGFNSAMVNGMPIMRSVQLNQDEGGEAESGPTAGDVTMGALDWGLVILGVAGVGFAVAEVADADESPDPEGGGGTTTGGGTGGGTPLGGTPLGGTPLGGGTEGQITCAPGEIPVIGGECLPGGPFTNGGRSTRGYRAVTAPEYLQWLDGGTGQMGDLVAH